MRKRGKVWHYDFQFNNRRYQGSTFLQNKEKAKQFVTRLRDQLAMGLVGLSPRKPSPLLEVFLRGEFLDHVRQHAKRPRTRMFYEAKVDRLCGYQPFRTARLDDIDELAIQGFKDWRQLKKLAVATINGELRTLRKAIGFAFECKRIQRCPRVHLLPNEHRREFVLTGELEVAYLARAEYPLREMAILILDLGLRPEEAVSLRKSDVTDEAVMIQEGKTANARRMLPQTARTREVFALLKAFFPDSPWVFPGRKGHLTRGAVDNLHTKLRNGADFQPEFVLYSCRHTFGTRLAESGASAFVIARVMGHSSIVVSQRYIHVGMEHLGVAMQRKEMLDKLIRGEGTDGVTANVRNGSAVDS